MDPGMCNFSEEMDERMKIIRYRKYRKLIWFDFVSLLLR